MNDESLVLRMLRPMDGKLDGLLQDMADLKLRVTAVEIQLGAVAAAEQSHYASVVTRLDRHDVRLDRIERRLGLIEAHAG
jgi:hypothetical protein